VRAIDGVNPIVERKKGRRMKERNEGKRGDAAFIHISNEQASILSRYRNFVNYIAYFNIDISD